MDLKTPLESAGRVYKMYAGRLDKLGITKLEDFLYHIPFRYEDFSLVSKIGQVQAGEKVTVQGKIEEIKNQYTRRFKSLQKAVVSDDTGKLNIIWFNQPYIPKSVGKDDVISLSGKVGLDGNKLLMQSPGFEVVFENQTIHTGRLVPIYPQTRGVSSKWLRRQVHKLLGSLSQIHEYLPQYVIDENNLMGITKAIEAVHFPNSLEQAEKAKQRLAFDELLNLQLSSLVRKKKWRKKKIKNPWEIGKYKTKIDSFIKNLPFELTNAQKNAVLEILKDLSAKTPMNRLLEGDVGSGKTVVAIIAALTSYLNGFQIAFMAPTEILANQHYKVIDKLLSPLGIKIELFTSATKKSKQFDIAVGTHALIYKKVVFENLGLVVIDEQQRFGVEQRAILKAKGNLPAGRQVTTHLLTMTATPIPRTVALTMYGDLDLSILDEMPRGRKLIKTWVVPPSKRNGAYEWLEEKIRKTKDQVFIVCPFIEESESMITVKAAVKEFERLKREVFPKLQLGLLHGKMKPGEKEEILKKFREGKTDILVSTPVVEVGIDIPNATIMIIEEAERFGLAQLHQLRGRVGRGEKESFCLLFTSSQNPDTLKRLKSLETMYSGAELAELDLKLRGPGQLYGVLQHGIPQLKVASFSDFELIQKTKADAEKLFPRIDEFPKLKEKIEEESQKQISPD
ncbi:MAG: DNA helicase RecG [Candidatus Levybacteria bacterium CG10_big_fil_rev_8_21_14_0_10_35_13]|nr:MAG: DNA helicase RecG [Candidatus Levybacteria bacterium CG10_big_fil_rev_8_21_14_0_10_35_13]